MREPQDSTQSPLRFRWIIQCLFCVLTLTTVTTVTARSLIAPNSTWRYATEIKSPNTQDASWWQPQFNDAAWSTGNGPFRYGDGKNGTELSDMAGNYPSVLLRKQFTLDRVNQIAALDLRVDYDDGFKVWINGHPVLSINAPQNNDINALATDSHESGEYETFELPNVLPTLLEGKNLIAIQAFNVSLSSTDFLIDAALITIETDFTAPTIEQVTPFPGLVEDLREITFQFSEPVVGIDPDDLRLNNTPADSVSGEGNRWSFAFPTLDFGEARLTWNPNHGIRDLARPPNPFEASGTGEETTYQFVDHTSPTLTSVMPPPGSTLGSLDRITLFFSEPVRSMSTRDIRIHGTAPTSVEGFSVGPWHIRFEPVPPGGVQVNWTSDHDIVDRSPTPNRLNAPGWSYTVDPTKPPASIVINEVLSSNQSGIRDEDGTAVDWIELRNTGTSPINLLGWALSDDKTRPDKWTFPSVEMAPDALLLVFASGKDRRDPTRSLHTNFKLSSGGGYLSLSNPELPRQTVGKMRNKIPSLPPDTAYGATQSGEYSFLATPTPGTPNQSPQSIRVLSPPTLSPPGGMYPKGITLAMMTPEPNAVIRYTSDFTEPTGTNGRVYRNPIQISTNTVIRAAVFSENSLPSRVITRTFVIDDASAIHSLPLLSLATDPTHLRGDTGIMERNPRNTTKRGIAWERPVSAELLYPDRSRTGFQVDCGLRIQGGDYIRHNYRPNTPPPTGKYSFRLYFRGKYGATSLDFPFFGEIPRKQFQHLTLRAGMNDPINPFIVDELIRRLSADMGQAASQGTIVNLMLNGVHQGYYNPTERIDRHFLQSRHGGGSQWDLIAQREEVREGDMKEWQRLRKTIIQADLQAPENYLRATRQLDIDNFIDYLILNIYVDMDDWPSNNWRAARERVPRARWRFYVWDGERAFGTEGKRTLGTLSRQRWPQKRTVTSNNLTRGPLTGTSEIARMFRSLLRNATFRQRFADRVHHHFFNNGALTQQNIKQRHAELHELMRAVLPDMNLYIEREWIPKRQAVIMEQLASLDLQRSENAPQFSQHGGTVPRGHRIILKAQRGTVFFTTDGSDPQEIDRHPPSTKPYQTPIEINRPVTLKARTMEGKQWSALTQATFLVEDQVFPIQITEVMSTPHGGREYEFIELWNTSKVPQSLSWHRLKGVDFIFPFDAKILPRQRLILASDIAPGAFAQRYPKLAVSGWFRGTLAGQGERLELISKHGKTLTSTTYPGRKSLEDYKDGHSLERTNPSHDSGALNPWRQSKPIGGTPGF